MKHRSAILIVLLALVTLLTPGTPSSQTVRAAAGPSGTCAQVSFSGFAEGQTDFRIVVDTKAGSYVSAPVTENGPFTLTFNFGPVPEGTAVHAELQFDIQGWVLYDFVDYTCSGGGATSGGATCGSTDGRINRVCEEPWQTAAIYCDSDGGITVYKINADASGTFAFKATEAEIAEVSATPKVNTPIKEGLGITLYRLTSGEFEVVAPTRESSKLYTFIWKACA